MRVVGWEDLERGGRIQVLSYAAAAVAALASREEVWKKSMSCSSDEHTRSVCPSLYLAE